MTSARRYIISGICLVAIFVAHNAMSGPNVGSNSNSTQTQRQSNESEASDAGSAQAIIRRAQRIPFVGSRLTEIGSILGVDANGSAAGNFNAWENSGINRSNADYLRDKPCFAELAARFYDEITIEDNEASSLMTFEQTSILRQTRNGTHSLAETCDPQHGCAPGFLWEKAKEFSHASLQFS